MDPISQGVVGATLAVAACRKPQSIGAAALAGAVGGMLADADILLRSADDPLFALQMHRHFTHSLAFVPIGGVIAGLLCYPLLRRRLSLAMCILFAMLGYLTHGVLDSMTSYGTHLFWPFTGRRESWSIISIIDPVFTLTLLTLLTYAVLRRRRTACLLGCCFALLYWSAGVIQQDRARDMMLRVAEQRGHVVLDYEVKPALGNILIWRSMYRTPTHIYTDAVRAGITDPMRWYDGESVEALDPARALPNLPKDSALAYDIKRFAFFSDGWLAVVDTPESEKREGAGQVTWADMRYAYMPQKLKPLWGISFDPARPDAHAHFHNIARRDLTRWPEYKAMLLGESAR